MLCKDGSAVRCSAAAQGAATAALAWLLPASATRGCGSLGVTCMDALFSHAFQRIQWAAAEIDKETLLSSAEIMRMPKH